MGAGKCFARAFKEIVKSNRPNLVALEEPRCSGSRAQKIIKCLGFKHNIMVDSRGFAGGIWLFWNRGHISMPRKEDHDQFLHVEV